MQEDTAEMMTRFRRRERPVAARRCGWSGASVGELRVLDGQVAPEVLVLGEEGDWVRHDEAEMMERLAASIASWNGVSTRMEWRRGVSDRRVELVLDDRAAENINGGVSEV